MIQRYDLKLKKKKKRKKETGWHPKKKKNKIWNCVAPNSLI